MKEIADLLRKVTDLSARNYQAWIAKDKETQAACEQEQAAIDAQLASYGLKLCQDDNYDMAFAIRLIEVRE